MGRIHELKRNSYRKRTLRKSSFHTEVKIRDLAGGKLFLFSIKWPGFVIHGNYDETGQQVCIYTPTIVRTLSYAVANSK